MNFEELKRFYSENYSLGYLNSSDLSTRLALVSLICYVTYKSKQKDPDATYYSIIMKLNKGINVPDKFVKGLAIVCEDFGYMCDTFPTFGLKGKEILVKIQEILKSYVPF